MIQNAWLIPLLPFIAFILIVFVSKNSRMGSAITAIATMLTALMLSMGIFYQTVTNPSISMQYPVEIAIQWLQVGSLTLEMGLLIDPLTGVMLFVVTFIASLVMIYSFGYMDEDPGFSRFYAFLSLFTFSMLGLVVANNFFQMFVFWELVGLSSYLLIGFWYHKNSAVEANKKAFLTNRVADFGFLLGIIMLFYHFGTFNFLEIGIAVQGFANLTALTVIALLIFIGPMGKSGQMPLHVWLPDAMEGPTPVSALVHSATMVAAGVYLLARAFVLFAAAPGALTVIAYVGGLTAFFMATIALTQNDFKRILAFSTLSQLGFMVMAIGVGSITAAMFHLTTHAFFKALLFLGAGSVLHGVGKKTIWEMGDLRKKMPITTYTFIIGTLALAGIFPLAGFWSKDAILLAVDASGYTFLWYLATFTAFLTTFYMFRLVFVAFFGKGNPENHAHESPKSMTIPLVVLAGMSIVAGVIGSPYMENGIANWIYFDEIIRPEFHLFYAGKATVIVAAGAFLAYLIYYKQVISATKLKERFKPIHTLLYNKYYFDEFYQFIFHKGFMNIGRSFIWSDRRVVDGFVDGYSNMTKAAGEKARRIQTGNLQNYALIAFVAIVIIVLVIAVTDIGGAL